MRRLLTVLALLLTCSVVSAQQIQTVRVLDPTTKANVDVGDAVNTAIRVTSNGEDLGTEATLSVVATNTDRTADNLDALLLSAAIDATHGNPVEATGPHFLGEAKNIDGAALPNVVAEGQATRIATTLSGAVLVTVVNEAGTFDVAAGLGDVQGVEDVTETTDRVLMMIGATRRDAAASSSANNTDNSTFNVDALGLLWTRFLDPCSGVAKTVIPINIAAGPATTEITPALSGAANFYYVCSVNLVTALANNVALTDDNTDNCGSVDGALAGGVTAATGWNFAANGGIALGNGGFTVAKTTSTNRVICLMTSAATQLSGTIVVAAAP